MTCVLSPTGLIPWFSKTEGNTYATLLHHPFLFKGKPTQCSRGSKMPQVKSSNKSKKDSSSSSNNNHVKSNIVASSSSLDSTNDSLREVKIAY